MSAVDVLAFVLLPLAVAYHTVTLLMVLISAFEIRRLRVLPPAALVSSARDSGELPPVSILVPAYNEEAAITRTVDSLLALDYPQFEIIVISDGSEDRTVDLLRERFGLVPCRNESQRQLITQRIKKVYAAASDERLRVLDKRNGGKADALNAGIDCARYPLVLAVDADVVVDPDALVHLAVPFILDERTIASSGIIRPQNGCAVEHGRVVRTAAPSNWLERIQVVEYLRAYGLGRMFFSRFNAQLIISGAFGLFSRRLLVELGGYQAHAVGEDMELVVRAHRYMRLRGTPYSIAFAPDALCLTEAPHSWTDLAKQRTRWHQGLLSTLRLHRSMAGRRRFGAAGMLAFPYYVAELLFPFIEALGWLLLALMLIGGTIAPGEALRFTMIVLLLGTAVSLAALTVDAYFFSFFNRRRDRLALALAAFAEQIGFRQCTVYFRLRAFFRYYRTLQLRSAWRSPTRKKIAEPASRREN